MPVIPDRSRSRSTRLPPRRRGAVALALIAMAVAGCGLGTYLGSDAQEPEALPDPSPRPEAVADYIVPVRPIALLTVDEDGEPVPGAEATVGDLVHGADEQGRIVVRIDQPTLAIVTAPNHLAEPVVLTLEEPEVPVTMLRRIGPSGNERIVMHFGGDVMLGRRYLLPDTDRGQIVDPEDDGESARRVVAGVAPLFGAADISSINFESVIGDHPQEAAYPGKRFLLQSPPTVLAALDELGVDVATLGNNHSNDWQLPGVLSTIDALTSAGIAAPGAGADAVAARRPAVLGAGPVEVGFLSYTTVTGDFVNDSLPSAAEAIPAGVSDEDAWQYMRRSFQFAGPDGGPIVPQADYLPGEAWLLFRQLETVIDRSLLNALWRSLTAAEAFPQLQDWVARRGHGGAAWYRSAEVVDDVAALRRSGVDLAVVQIHGGYQFAEVSSEFFARAARAAVDAGADLVVGHHPHVLQGYEFYKGKLIAHSLGNFVFDQDFLSTFPSAVLRTVYEGDHLVVASVFPVVLDAYHPKPAVGTAADEILQMLNERSAGAASTIRLPTGSIGAVPVEREPDVAPAELHRVGSGAFVLRPADSTTTAQEVVLDAHAIGRVMSTDPIDLQTLGDGVLIGTDLLVWGSFEDVTADRSRRGGMHWAVPDTGPVRLRTVQDGEGSNTFVEMTAQEGFTSDVVVRPVARVTPAPHRLFDVFGEPIDGVASYTFRASVRVEAGAKPFLRLDAYHFDDTDPTRDPESILLASTPLRIDVPDDGAWHQVTIDISADAMRPEHNLSANSVMMYLGIPPPKGGDAVAAFDDIELIEWRAAGSYPPGTRRTADAVHGFAGWGSVTLHVG